MLPRGRLYHCEWDDETPAQINVQFAISFTIVQCHSVAFRHSLPSEVGQRLTEQEIIPDPGRLMNSLWCSGDMYKVGHSHEWPPVMLWWWTRTKWNQDENERDQDQDGWGQVELLSFIQISLLSFTSIKLLSFGGKFKYYNSHSSLMRIIVRWITTSYLHVVTVKICISESLWIIQSPMSQMEIATVLQSSSSRHPFMRKINFWLI